MAINEFTVTLSYSYRVDDDTLEWAYATTDLEEAARIDQESFLRYPDCLVEDLADKAINPQVTVTAKRLEDE